MILKRIESSFFKQKTLKVAKDILGHFLIRKIKDDLLIGKIVEVEAYSQNDPASHSFRGKTERNQIMFREGGCFYVYFTYGMYYCANIVTEKEGFGSAVLLRAVEPVQGFDIMRKNRKRECSDIDLTNGPGKLCLAFGIDKSFNGAAVGNENLFIAENPEKGVFKTGISARIGINDGNDKLWRFFIKNNPFVSKSKPNNRRVS